MRLAKFLVLSKSLGLSKTECEMFFVFCLSEGNLLDLLNANCCLETELFKAITASATAQFRVTEKEIRTNYIFISTE